MRLLSSSAARWGLFGLVEGLRETGYTPLVVPTGPVGEGRLATNEKGEVMSRFTLVMVIIGGLVAFLGIREFWVSSGASTDPTEIDLAALERGEATENNHLKIGEHIALYPATVYECKVSKFDTGEPGPNAKVNHCYYPIIRKKYTQ